MESEATFEQPTLQARRPLAVQSRQPEVFETPDTDNISGPVVVVVEEQVNADIDRTGVAPNKAFARFYDKAGPSQDMSPSGRRAKQMAFEASKEDPRSARETPLQRFQRLQSEIRELSEELSAAAEKQTPLEQDIPALAIVNEVEQLRGRLEELISKEEHRPFLNPNYETEQTSIAHASLATKLLSHLEALSAKGKRKTAEPSGDKGQVTYELFCAPGLAEGMSGAEADLSVMSSLDKRVAQLEKLLGVNTFMGNMPTSDMLSFVEAMNDKLDLLNQVELDKVDRKLKMLSLELDDIARSEEKAGLPAHQEKRVNEVYEMMSRADATIQQMPAIISRLQSLRPLHEESLTFSQNLRHLHRQQSQIMQMISSHNVHLIKVEDGLAENMATIQTNFDALNARIDKLSDKLSTQQQQQQQPQQ